MGLQLGGNTRLGGGEGGESSIEGGKNFSWGEGEGGEGNRSVPLSIKHWVSSNKQ